MLAAFVNARFSAKLWFLCHFPGRPRPNFFALCGYPYNSVTHTYGTPHLLGSYSSCTKSVRGITACVLARSSLSLSLSRPGLRRKLTSSTRTHHFPRAIRRGALLASAMCLCCCGSPCEAGLQDVHVSVVLLRARGPLALTVYIGATVGRGAAGCVPLVLRFADCMQPHAGQLPSLSVAALCVLPMRPPPSLSADLTLVMQTQMCYAARFWALLLHWPYSGRCTPRHSLVGCLSNLRWRIVRCKPVSET